jgi:hypothetical protein
MDITIRIHDSWAAAVPISLGRVLAGLALLERPRPAGGDADDLGTLLDGLLDDAPESSPAPAARPSPAATAQPAAAPPLPPATPPATRPVAKPFEGIPTSGSQLYRWCCDHKLLPKANAIGKREGWHKLVTHWDADMVSLAHGELTALQPAANGQAR